MLQHKHVLITGGAGFIGSNLTRALATDNQITVIDDLSTGHQENISDLIEKDQIRFLKGSITDYEFVFDACADVDYVFHHAALPSVQESMKHPRLTNRVNVDGTLNVLAAASDQQIKKVVFASSSSIYGETNLLPISEENNPDPLSPYALSKLIGEHYALLYNSIYDLPTVCLRYFNVYGPRQDPHGAYAAVIPAFINNLTKHKSLTIYGDGRQTRDFVFVEDVIQANINAAETTVTGVYNIGSGSIVTITELAETLIDLMDANVDINYTDIRPGDIKDSYSTISKAEKDLGFIPSYSLKQGLQQTIEWFTM